MPPHPIAPRKRPRQSRSEATVDALVTAAVRVIRRDGYERASTNRIADVAGVSVGSLYQYFPSKASLVAHALERRIDHMGQMVERAFDEVASLDTREGTRRVIGAMLRDNATDRAFQKQYYELVVRVGVADRHRVYRAAATERIRRHLDTHRAAIGREKLDVVAVVCLDLVDAFLRSAFDRFPERLGQDSFADEVTAVVLDYLRPRPHDPAA
jgi:AcrR family transcriptional regulator